MFGGMFKRTRHRQFDYKPRFYDPIKEEIDERVRAKEMASINDREARRMRIGGGMRRNQGVSQIRKESTMRSNVLIALVAIILVLMAFLLLGDLSFLKK